MSDVIDLLQQPQAVWTTRFGDFSSPGTWEVEAITGVATAGGAHAETQLTAILGADFTFSADITLPQSAARDATDAHLQFRISDEGRYGVGIRHDRLRLYRFMLPERACSADPNVYTHCPLWTAPDDPPVFTEIGSARLASPPGSAFSVRIAAHGPRLTVWGGAEPIVTNREHDLGVGGFGLYVYSHNPQLGVTFRNIRVTTNALARSNFALLFSTVGYDVGRSKRAILRTLNDVPADCLDGARLTYTIIADDGSLLFEEPRPFAPAARPWVKTLGFQAWVADFTEVREPGMYTIVATVAGSENSFRIASESFAVEEHLLSSRLLKPLSIRNAEARRAAGDDMRRNWQIEDGHDAWSVGVDGAFIADQADDGAGAVLRRVFNINNQPLLTQRDLAKDFRYLARITIVDGLEAELQFRITGSGRWGVRIELVPGRWRHGRGLAAIRLYRYLPWGAAVLRAETAFGPEEFVLGRPYDLEIRVRGHDIVVLVDGTPIPIPEYFDPDPVPGQFALKARGGSVRFERVQSWNRDIPIFYRGNGVWIPYFPGELFGMSAQDVPLDSAESDSDTSLQPLPAAVRDHDTRYPLFSQYRGFHDCNNYIGEATSHGVFLAGLMDVWIRRAAAFAPAERESLRDAIVAATLYLFGLYEQGNLTGQFAHQETGRGALLAGDLYANTGHALYGLSSFAALGATVDRSLARSALEFTRAGWAWLNRQFTVDPPLRSIVLARMAAAAEREGMPDAEQLWDAAETATHDVLNAFSPPGAIAQSQREGLRSIPWFEGVFEFLTSGRIAHENWPNDQLSDIANQLRDIMNKANNVLQILPEATDNDNHPDIPNHNWNLLEQFPSANAPIPDPPVGDWYVCEHYATAAIDSVCIGELTDADDLQKLATGNLSWILGINPGIPSSKTVAPDLGVPWRAASFIYNGTGAFARTIEGFRTITTSSKGWRGPWEGAPPSRHGETWWIDPLGNGFHSIVNGHVLSDRQWHYWNVGIAGWVSGETFMLIDGTFLKATVALEDWGQALPRPRINPYDTSAATFLDTTHIDRQGTDWAFDYPDRTPAATAGRSVHQIAVNKGFASAKPTGHHIGERVGAIAIPAEAPAAWVAHETISASPWPFDDIDNDHWAQVARAATEIAVIQRRYVGGFFTGNVRWHAGQHWYELICLPEGAASFFDSTSDDNDSSPWGFDDINTVSWAQAARAATGIALDRGFIGGFFTGHQLDGKRGIVAFG